MPIVPNRPQKGVEMTIKMYCGSAVGSFGDTVIPMVYNGFTADSRLEAIGFMSEYYKSIHKKSPEYCDVWLIDPDVALQAFTLNSDLNSVRNIDGISRSVFGGFKTFPCEERLVAFHVASVPGPEIDWITKDRNTFEIMSAILESYQKKEN